MSWTKDHVMTAASQIDHVISILRSNQQSLRDQGVLHAAVFGSVARGEAGPESDVDIMVDLDDSVVRSLFDYAGIYAALEHMIGREIDLADAKRLKPHVRPSSLSEAIRAF
jgi:predicted nucleotidyltransferase